MASLLATHLTAMAAAAAAAAALVACVPDQADPYDSIEFGPGGAADGTGFPVVDVDVGQRLPSMTVEALPVDVSIEDADLSRYVIAVRVHGGAAAIVVRATGGNLDPYIIVKDRDKNTLSQSRTQAVAPSTATHDAIAIVQSSEESGEVIAMISGEELRSGGTFTLDVVGLPAPDLASELATTLESRPAQIIGRTLRQLEPSRAEMVVSGWIEEHRDGTVTENLPRIPLDQRTRVASMIANLTDARSQLSRQLAAADPAGALTDLAAIWAALAR